MTSFISRTVNNSIGRNVVFLGISGAAKGFSSIAFVLLAVRALEPGETGEVVLAFLAIRIVQNVAGVGFGRYLARESAHSPDDTNRLTLNVVKLILAAVPIAILGAAVAALIDPRLGLAVALAATAAVAGSTQQSLGGTFLGRERTYLDSASEVTSAVVLVGGGVAVALLDRGPVAYIGVIAASRLAACGLASWFFASIFRPRMALLTASLRDGFTQGLPYMLNAGSSFIFLRADIILLGVLSGTHAVSIYGGVADPLVTLAGTIHIVNTAFLPGLSSDPAGRQRLAGRMLGIDLVLGCSLAVVLFFAAGPFADRLFGDGSAAGVDVLRVLCAALALRFVNNGLATWLTASGHQWRRTAIAVAAGTFNVCANLIAIPIWGYWAAVWTTIATEGLIVVLSLVALGPELSLKSRPAPPERVRTSVTEGYRLGPE